MTAQPIVKNGNRPPDQIGPPDSVAGQRQDWRFRCPTCGSALTPDGTDRMVCEERQHHFDRRDGIWCCLSAERVEHFRQFMREYETVRQLEGRSSADSTYYRSLPFKDLTGRFTADWHIRATTYRAFVESSHQATGDDA